MQCRWLAKAAAVHVAVLWVQGLSAWTCAWAGLLLGMVSFAAFAALVHLGIVLPSYAGLMTCNSICVRNPQHAVMCISWMLECHDSVRHMRDCPTDTAQLSRQWSAEDLAL